MYRIGDKLEVTRVADDRLELKIGTEKASVFTEDLAALVAEELPKDRATELLASCETEMITSGKARVVVQAKKDIKQGEQVAFTIDVKKYTGGSRGIRASKSGIIY